MALTKKIDDLVTKIGKAVLGHEPTDVLLVLATSAAALCKKYGANPAAFIEAFNTACDAQSDGRDRHPRLVG